MTKVLIITNSIPHYRLDLFEGLGKYYELTILVYGNKVENLISNNFIVKYCDVYSILKFKIIKGFSKKYLNLFDVVICDFDFFVFQFYFLNSIYKDNYKLLNWGIGLSASYNKIFDKDRKFDFFRFRCMTNCDATIFYTKYAVDRYINCGYSSNKLFFANNTVKVNASISNSIKDSFLFIGTLYKEKGILDLLEAYYQAKLEFNYLPKLFIIGEGAEEDFIKKYIFDLNLSDEIIMCGKIYDPEKLKLFFGRAIATISPNQAGLSVLNSFGHGVPFITKVNSITGGERLNILNNYNGFLYSDNMELKRIILELSANFKLQNQLSSNSIRYYNEFATMDNMIHSFIKAVEYTLSN